MEEHPRRVQSGRERERVDTRPKSEEVSLKSISKNESSMKGKTVVVTGATSGIGEVAALTLGPAF